MTVSLIRLAFDSGWSHGDPGDGRLRFDSPHIAKASCICINARCAQETLLDQLVPTWGIGDVLAIERATMDRNRTVAWIIGPITHGGSYFRIPVKVRSVSGSFAAHDELVLHHHLSETETDTPPQQVASPIAFKTTPPPLPPTAPMTTVSFQPLELMAPMALTNGTPAKAAQNQPPALPVAPLAPMALTNTAAQPPRASDDALRAEVDALHGIIAELLNDKTEVYAVETNQ